jgi:hypothetical protein
MLLIEIVGAVITNIPEIVYELPDGTDPITENS